MKTNATAIEEYRRCADRLKELEISLGRLQTDEARLLEEMGKVDEQLSYYASLTRDMKASVQPPRLARLMRSLGKP